MTAAVAAAAATPGAQAWAAWTYHDDEYNAQCEGDEDDEGGGYGEDGEYEEEGVDEGQEEGGAAAGTAGMDERVSALGAEFGWEIISGRNFGAVRVPRECVQVLHVDMPLPLHSLSKVRAKYMSRRVEEALAVINQDDMVALLREEMAADCTNNAWGVAMRDQRGDLHLAGTVPSLLFRCVQWDPATIVDHGRTFEGTADVTLRALNGAKVSAKMHWGLEAKGRLNKTQLTKASKRAQKRGESREAAKRKAVQAMRSSGGGDVDCKAVAELEFDGRRCRYAVAVISRGDGHRCGLSIDEWRQRIASWLLVTCGIDVRQVRRERGGY